MTTAHTSLHLTALGALDGNPRRHSADTWWQQSTRSLARVAIMCIAILAMIPRLEAFDITSSLQAQWSFNEGGGIDER